MEFPRDWKRNGCPSPEFTPDATRIIGTGTEMNAEWWDSMRDEGEGFGSRSMISLYVSNKCTTEKAHGADTVEGG